MNPILENLLGKADLLLMFGGFTALLWKAMSALQAANTENATLAQILARLMAGQPVAPIPIPRPVTPVASVPGKPPQASPAPTVSHTPSDAVTPGLVAFIKKTEGFSAKAYWDYKQYSIGYGTKANSANEVIDEATATQRLTDEIHKADKLVTDRFPNLPLGQHQALLDLTYNAGSGWEDGSLGAAVAAQKIDTIKADILLYNHAGGVVSAGLTARREAEVSWFDNPI